MKTYKIYITALFAAVFITGVNAQTTTDSVVNKTVNVTREFKPVISDVGKILIEPKTVEPVVARVQPVYSDVVAPLIADYDIHTLPATELKFAQPERKTGFLRLAGGLPGNTLADFAYPVLNDERNRLDMAVHHLGAFADQQYAKSSASIKYDHLFNKVAFYTSVDGRHDFFNYYGRTLAGDMPFVFSSVARTYGQAKYKADGIDQISFWDMSGYVPLTNTHWRVNASAGLRSLPFVNDNLIFDGRMSYNLFHTVDRSINENQIRLKGLFEVPFNLNWLGMDMDVYRFIYSGTFGNGYALPDNYTLVKLNPYLKFGNDNWSLRLGAKTGIAIGGAGQLFSPSADVKVHWNALPEYLSLYGAVTGDLAVNSMSEMFDQNRYLLPQIRITDTYTPVDAYFGLKLSPVHSLLFDIYGQYKIISNQYFYVSKAFERTESLPDMPIGYSKIYLNAFDVVYSHASCASLGLRTSWDYKNQINLYLKGAHHFWNVKDEQHAWHQPAWVVDFGANVKIGNDMALNTQFYFQDGRYAKLSDAKGTRMGYVFDWNIGFSYAYRDWMSFFLRVNNILNSSYEFFYGYQVQGINGLAGVAFSL